MLKTLSFFILFIFNFCTSFSQRIQVNVFSIDKASRPTGDTIYYNTNKRLAWKDFKGTPDTKHFGGAVTASGYAFDADIKIEGRTTYINIGVYVYFTKSESWKKPNINSDYHLMHEQLHFDITRLGAESFINQLVKSKFTKDNYSKILDSVFEKSYNDNIAMQNQYDKETQHSINQQMQIKWNAKISQEIKKIQ